MFKHAIVAATVATLIQAAPALAAPVQWTAGNGHWYEVITVEGITWTDAQAAALAAGGYLATIGDEAEDLFVQSLLPTPPEKSRSHYWIGATDETTEGVFAWVDGATPPFIVDPTSPWQPFRPGEPNNVSYGDDEFEDYLAYDFNGGWGWNDAPDDLQKHHPFVRGYILERNTIPEPASLTLLAIGGLTAVWARRRRNIQA